MKSTHRMEYEYTMGNFGHYTRLKSSCKWHKSCETHIAFKYVCFLTKCTSKNRSRTKNTICAFMEGMKEQSEIARTNMNFRNKPQDIQPILNLQELMRKQ